MIRLPNTLVATVIVAVVALAVLGFYETNLIKQARQAMTHHDYNQALKMADSVAFPPFTTIAANIREVAAASKEREAQSKDAQTQAYAINKSLGKVDVDLMTGDGAFSEALNKYKKAIASGQARHDDALSGHGSIDFQLSNAKLEKNNFDGMGSDIPDAISDYRDALAEFSSMFGQRETSRLEDAVDGASTGYEDGVSSAFG
jgi:tetratricopeptide (TPR) repeat protein